MLDEELSSFLPGFYSWDDSNQLSLLLEPRAVNALFCRSWRVCSHVQHKRVITWEMMQMVNEVG